MLAPGWWRSRSAARSVPRWLAAQARGWRRSSGCSSFALAAPALALRPQLFGIAIFAALLWLVAKRTEHPRWLWAAPLLVVLWANIHGSFVLAPLVLGYAWLDDVAREAPAAPVAVRPRRRPARDVRDPVRPRRLGLRGGDRRATRRSPSRVSEWQRTTPLTVPGALFYASAIGTLLVMWRGRPALRWPDWLWTAGMLAIGAWTVRGLAWWPFAAAFVVAAALPLVLASLRPGAPSLRRDPRAWSARSSPSCSSSPSSPRCRGGGPRTR